MVPKKQKQRQRRRRRQRQRRRTRIPPKKLPGISSSNLCLRSRKRIRRWLPPPMVAEDPATATAVAASMLLCAMHSRCCGMKEGSCEGKDREVLVRQQDSDSKRRRGPLQRPVIPPSTWWETFGMAVDTVRFVLSETLGKWPIGDLTFGIMSHTRRQGNLEVANEFAGNECVELKGHEILVELISLLRLLKLCFSFSREKFQVLLESAGCSADDVLLKEAKARFLKPAFTILLDRNKKNVLLLIRGALSLKDKLTAATGAVVPFQHVVLHEGNISNSVMGYAHSGMVVAARWLAKCTTPCLQKAMLENPDYNLKIVGHSMGAGIAAILTYILREHKEFSSSTCVAFGPACCMTWNLAESGKHFVTSVINATDLVPTFSTVSVSNLRNEDTDTDDLIEPLANSNKEDAPALETTSGNGSLVYDWFNKKPASVNLVNDSKASNFEEIHDRQGHLQLNRVFPAASAEEVSEDQFWFVLADDICGDDEDGPLKPAATSKIKLDPVLNDTTENKQPDLENTLEEHQLFPPGRTMHMVASPPLDADPGEDALSSRNVGIYETPRYLYGKIRLSQTMIDDHYMPRYKLMMELLIQKLKAESNASTTVVT